MSSGASPSDPPLTMLLNLFFTKKFLTHRLMGLVYLIQFALAFFLYFYNFEMFYNSPLIWSLPFTGFMQSIVAASTFTFLPKKQDDPGYYGDKSTLSYNFVVENIYFSGILLFQWLYMHEKFVGFFNEYALFLIEATFVFLPYFVIRPFFPKTHFRDGLKIDKNKSAENTRFFIIATWVTKIFYVWAKHFIGFFLNYSRFFDRLSEGQIYHIYLMLIFSSAATTISMFLHTLKFKKYIGPITAFVWYMFTYLLTFYSWIRIYDVFSESPDLALFVLIGIVVNFSSQYLQLLVQTSWLALFSGQRLGLLPPDIAAKLFSAVPPAVVM